MAVLEGVDQISRRSRMPAIGVALGALRDEPYTSRVIGSRCEHESAMIRSLSSNCGGSGNCRTCMYDWLACTGVVMTT